MAGFIPSTEEARRKLQKLIDIYNHHKDDKAFIGNEKQACQSLIVIPHIESPKAHLKINKNIY